MNKAMRLKPNYTVYMYDLATFYEKVEDYENAMKLLNKAIVQKPQYPEDEIYIKRCKALIDRLQELKKRK